MRAAHKLSGGEQIGRMLPLNRRKGKGVEE